MYNYKKIIITSNMRFSVCNLFKTRLLVQFIANQNFLILLHCFNLFTGSESKKEYNTKLYHSLTKF